MVDNISIDKKIEELEAKKKDLIESIKSLTKQLKYKKIEYNALKPLAEEAEKRKLGNIVRDIKIIEFKIATQALSPKAERKYVKKVMELEKKLKKYRPMLTAKKKIKRLEEEMKELESKINEVENQLKSIRGDLRKLYGEKKLEKVAKSKGIVYGKEVDTFVTLEEAAIIEEKD